MSVQLKLTVALLSAVLALAGIGRLAHAANLEAGNTLPRLPGAFIFGPSTVWTKSSNTDWIFHPLSTPMPAGDIISVRVDIALDQDTAQCSARPALRFGSDGVTWDNSKDIDATYTNAPGITYGGAFVDITQLGITPKAMVQFGVQVKNTSGVALEFCKAQLRIQLKRT